MKETISGIQGEDIQSSSQDNMESGWSSLSKDAERLWRQAREERREKGLGEKKSSQRERGEKTMLAILQRESPTWQHKNQTIDLRKSAKEQEKVEEAINESFMSIEELEAIVDSEAAESSRREVEFEGKRITILNTGNLPFRYLRHSIQYSGGEGQPLVKNPSLWDLNERQVQDFLPNYSNMLSMEYRDSIESRKWRGSNGDRELAYGFLRLPATSLSTVSSAGQVLRKDRNQPSGFNLIWINRHPKEEIPQKLIQAGFMELQAFRYDDDSGRPSFHPDFIIAPSDGINDDTLRQAAYFNVPIFEIPAKEVSKHEK